MMRDFAAIDFETANNEPTSVCSVGIVVVRDCEIVNSFYSLIKPEPDYYTFWTTQVHGLSEADTWDSPVFPDVWAKVEPLIDGLPLVAHNKAFDENCLKAVFRCYQMDYPDYEFHCTLVKSRRVWPGGKHNLDIIAARCGFDLAQHHHALADAEACAAIAIKLFNPGDDPYYMEASEKVLSQMRELGEPVKCATLSEIMRTDRKTIDLAMRHLREDGLVSSSRRGYWEVI